MTRKMRGTTRAAGVVAIATVLAGTGMATASALPGRTGKSGTERFYLMSTLRDASRYEVIATGLFTSSGTDVSGGKSDTVRLVGGTFKVNHGGPAHIIKQQVNHATCVSVFEVTSKITIGGGSGRYAGITGTGNATVNVLQIAPRSSTGACNANATPVASEETITATANVKL